MVTNRTVPDKNKVSAFKKMFLKKKGSRKKKKKALISLNRTHEVLFFNFSPLLAYINNKKNNAFCDDVFIRVNHSL